ncbi:MAG: hypothetical protein R3D68_17800 [Hyphomicrobiaceae bacterium]
MATRDMDLGTEELEHGMRPGRARDAALIIVIVVAMLALFNSGGLVRWAERLPSSDASFWINERALQWDDAMRRLGPATLFEQIRERIRGT